MDIPNGGFPPIICIKNNINSQEELINMKNKKEKKITLTKLVNSQPLKALEINNIDVIDEI